MGHSRPLFLYFFNTVDSRNNVLFKTLSMTVFEPRTSATALPTEPQPLPKFAILLWNEKNEQCAAGSSAARWLDYFQYFPANHSASK